MGASGHNYRYATAGCPRLRVKQAWAGSGARDWGMTDTLPILFSIPPLFLPTTPTRFEPGCGQARPGTLTLACESGAISRETKARREVMSCPAVWLYLSEKALLGWGKTAAGITPATPGNAGLKIRNWKRKGNVARNQCFDGRRQAGLADQKR